MGAKKVTVEYKDDVAIITMRDGKNMLDFEFLAEFNAALDEVISNPNATALITTGEGKFYSNGIDLMKMASLEKEDKQKFMSNLCHLVARILTFPMPTVAALNGHAFAGGAFIAFAHDYRVMNKDRGWLSINEIHMPSRIPFFLLDVLRCKLPLGHVQTEVISFGKRLTGPEAKTLGVVQAISSPETLIGTSVDVLRSSLALGGFDRDALGWMKRDLYQAGLARLDTEVMPEMISKL